MFTENLLNSASTAGSSWNSSSPSKSARKMRMRPEDLNEFTPVAKEQRKVEYRGETNFCKLLNESDNLSIDSYQMLKGESTTVVDGEYETIRQKVRLGF